MRSPTCPWCGKSLRARDIKKISTSKAFMRFIIARCVHCNNVYGQNYNFESIWPHTIAFLASVILTVTVHYAFIYCILLSFFATDYVPFTRFDDRFDPLKDTRPLYKLTVTSGKIRKKRYYFTDDFDSLPSFSTVSPIEIRKIKKAAVYFRFTYEHVENSQIFDTEKMLYNIEGKSIATVICEKAT